MRSFANPVLWRIACAGFLTLVFGIPQTMAQRRQLETAETLRSRVLKTDRLEEGSVEDDREEAEAAEEADEKATEELELLEPFGDSNPQPVFMATL